MKNYNPRSFALGILFTLAVISIYSFTESSIVLNKQSDNHEAKILQGIDPGLAVVYQNNYKMLYPDKLQGVNISLQQLQAINQLMSERNNNTTNLAGFRLYYGSTSTESSGSLVSMAYSINNDLQEDPPGPTVNMAQGFNRSFSQPCPSFCD